MRLAAVVLGLAVAVALLETTLRLTDSPPPRLTGVVEEYRVPVDAPHFRETVSPEPDAASFRIWVIGDSFTWGDGIYSPDSWGRRLEYLIESVDRSVDIELSTVSRPGWNTMQELAAVEERFDDYDTDLLVLGYCINDAESRRRYGLEDIVEPLVFRPPKGLLVEGLYRASRLFRVGYERLERARQRRALRRYYREIYERPGWQRTREALDGFRELAWNRGVPLVAAVFPVFDQQIDEGYDYRDLHRLVMTELRLRDIPAIDLRHAYRGIDARRLAVDPFADPHPNELAHRIAAQTVARFLIENRLTPLDPQQAARLELSSPRPRGRPQ